MIEENKTKISEELQYLYQAEQDLSISFGGVVVWTSDDVYDELAHYCDWTFHRLPPFGMSFLQAWEKFYRQRGADYERLYNGFRIDYSPINNYDMTETETRGRAVDNKQTVNTPEGGSTTTTNNDLTNTLNRTGFNSVGNGSPYDTTTNTGTVTATTTAAAGTKTTNTETNSNTLKADNLTGDFHEIEAHTLTRSGNIGVSTSADILRGEYDLRKSLDLLAAYVLEFVKKYCYFVGGVE